MSEGDHNLENLSGPGAEGGDGVVAFAIGDVTVEVLSEPSTTTTVPPSEWRGNRVGRFGTATIGSVSAADDLRTQVSLVRWPDGDEFSLDHAEVFGKPAGYAHSEEARLIFPQHVGDNGGHAPGTATNWSQIDKWAVGGARTGFRGLDVTASELPGELLLGATGLKIEPVVDVRTGEPRALIAVYALTRVLPTVTSIDVTVEPPVDESPGEFVRALFTFMSPSSADLYVTCHSSVKPAEVRWQT
jgi:hypothetical protein